MAEQIFKKTVLATEVERYAFDFGRSKSEPIYSQYIVTFKSKDQSKIDAQIKNGDRQVIRFSAGDTLKIYSTYKNLPVNYDWKLQRKNWAKDLKAIIIAYYSIQKLSETQKDYLFKILDKILKCKENLEGRDEDYISRFDLGLYRLPVEVNLDE